MKRIDIIPFAGLCNRMRTISSGIQIAHELSIVPTIYWNKTLDCNTYFQDLFKMPPTKYCKVVENNSILFKFANKNNVKIPLLLQKIVYDQVLYRYNIKDGNIFNVIDLSRERLLLASYHTMYKHFDMTKIFVPTADIQKEIDDVVCKFDHTIGVHIRRTDHVLSKKESPLESFIRVLNNEINKDDLVSFYLATDDFEVKKEIVRIFGNRIITCNCELSRSSLEGMKYAVVDLFCLSRTARIIGSASSSYSETASELGGINLTIAH